MASTTIQFFTYEPNSKKQVSLWRNSQNSWKKFYPMG
jgi:hypothetical protein